MAAFAELRDPEEGAGFFFFFPFQTFTLKHLFIYGCTGCWLLLTGFFQLWREGYSLAVGAGFSLWWLLLLQSSVAVTHGPSYPMACGILVP